jgi:hypothetical protein
MAGRKRKVSTDGNAKSKVEDVEGPPEKKAKVEDKSKVEDKTPQKVYKYFEPWEGWKDQDKRIEQETEDTYRSRVGEETYRLYLNELVWKKDCSRAAMNQYLQARRNDPVSLFVLSSPRRSPFFSFQADQQEPWNGWIEQEKLKVSDGETLQQYRARVGGDIYSVYEHELEWERYWNQPSLKLARGART